MLASIKDKPEQLEKLYQYMLDELNVEDKAGDDLMVAKRYANLVKEVADSLSAAMVSYINPDTLIIHRSDEIQVWFAFRQKCLRKICSGNIQWKIVER